MILEENYEKLFNATEIRPKKGTGKSSTSEVSVTKVSVGYAFTFGGEAAVRIGSRVRVLVNNDAVFFPRCEDGGFAATLKRNGTRVVRVVESKAPAILNKFIGDYDLQFMAPVGVYFIQRDENVKNQ
jgi:hypothetical protein